MGVAGRRSAPSVRNKGGLCQPVSGSQAQRTGSTVPCLLPLPFSPLPNSAEQQGMQATLVWFLALPTFT